MRCLLLVLLVSCVSFAKADDRLPIPDKAAQQEADELVQTVFGEQIRAVTKPDAKSALVKTLLEESAATDTSPAGRYAMLKAALDVAPDATVAMSVIDEMAKHFQVDERRAKVYTLKRMSASAVLPHARKPLAEAAMQLANSYVAQDNFPAALALIDIALAAATNSRDAQLKRDVRARKSDVHSLQDSYAAVKQAMVTLETDPADAKSNLVVGRYKCLVKGDWYAGLPMFALGDDVALQKLAAKELKGPKTSGGRLELGDSWFDLAQHADDVTKERMLQRAGVWYGSSLRSDPALTRLAKIKVEQRLNELAPLMEKLAANNALARPPLAIAPFDEATAKKYQQAWAKYLRVPVEKEVDLSGDVKLTLVLIPPGEFLMGSTAEDQTKFLAEAKATRDKWSVNLIPNESPQHRVRITKPFYLGKYEVTQAQCQAVMNRNPSRFKGNPTHPVEKVSWNMIQPFLAKLNASASADKMTFALPTEAQWEYACRAGTTKPYYGGESENDLRKFGWFRANSDGRTHPVGQLRPNAFGLYDLHGNVWEWCADWHATDYYANAPLDDPAGPSKGSRRVFRGGGWGHGAGLCRSALRNSGTPGYLPDNDHRGYRLATVLAEE